MASFFSIPVRSIDSKASLEKLSKLSAALNRTEASLLREALDDLFIKHSEAL